MLAHTADRSIEGINQIRRKTLLLLYFQQIIDCVTRNLNTVNLKGKYWIGGGYIHNALNHVMKYVSVADKSYPLDWFCWHGRCHEVGMEVVAAIDGYRGNMSTEKVLMRIVSKHCIEIICLLISENYEHILEHHGEIEGLIIFSTVSRTSSLSLG